MDIEIVYQLILALILGSIVGLERELKKRGAGLQTYSLVALGSCLFTIIAFELIDFFVGQPIITFDPSRIIQAVAIGVGFIGGGVIFRQGAGIAGLTTAAGLWVAAAVGVAIGAKFYFLAIVATLLALFILVVFGFFEKKFIDKKLKK